MDPAGIEAPTKSTTQTGTHRWYRWVRLRGQVPVPLVVGLVMAATIGMASRLYSQHAGCETRADVEARVGDLSRRLQELASAHRISMSDLSETVKTVNAADTQFGGTAQLQLHCRELDRISAGLPDTAS